MRHTEGQVNVNTGTVFNTTKAILSAYVARKFFYCTVSLCLRFIVLLPLLGWGKTVGTANSLPDILQQAMLPVVSHRDCVRKYGSTLDQKAHLCAGEARANAAGGCNGDSGGPFVCREGGKWVLHGAVSFGQRNCPTTHYTVFTRLSSYLDWIRRYIPSGTVFIYLVHPMNILKNSFHSLYKLQ